MAGAEGQSDRGGRRPRLADVARLCGVSAATVSRVLNHDEKFSARPEVRRRIIEAARQIGYAPDLAARNLNRGKTHIVGVFGSPYTHIGEGINDAMFAGIAQTMRSADYDVFFELASRRPQDRALPFWRFDGAILIQSTADAVVAELGRRHAPYVCVNESIGEPAATVLVDDAGGATQALEHLAELGHRRIAYANAPRDYLPHYSIDERHDTAVNFCQSRGLTLVPGHEQRDMAPQRFIQRAIAEHQATALLAYDHRTAIATLGAAQSMNLRVPDDLSLVCFNDEFPVAAVHPPLTVVAMSGRAMGEAAAELLLKAMRNETAGAEASPRVRLPETLIVRASTGPPKSG